MTWATGMFRLIRLAIDEIERIPPQADVKLMVPAGRLTLAARAGLIAYRRAASGWRGVRKPIAGGNLGNRLVRQ